MAHEGRGDIDQEKKGRPGIQTGNTESPRPSRPHDLTTGWLPRATPVAVRHLRRPTKVTNQGDPTKERMRV